MATRDRVRRSINGRDGRIVATKAPGPLRDGFCSLVGGSPLSVCHVVGAADGLGIHSKRIAYVLWTKTERENLLDRSL